MREVEAAYLNPAAQVAWVDESVSGLPNRVYPLPIISGPRTMCLTPAGPLHARPRLGGPYPVCPDVVGAPVAGEHGRHAHDRARCWGVDLQAVADVDADM